MAKRKKTNVQVGISGSTNIPKNSTNGLFIKGYLPVRIRVPKIIHSNHSNNNNPNETTTTTSTSFNINMFHETILYVKEHQSGNNTTTTSSSTSNNMNNVSTTLFVANAPVVPYVSTQLLLKSIFGRYGEVIRVTVIANPRKRPNTSIEDISSCSSSLVDGNDCEIQILQSSWTTTKFSNTTINNNSNNDNLINQNGKFAHVVFESTREMKNALGSIIKVMKSTYKSNDDKVDEDKNNVNDDDIVNESPAAIVLDPIEIQTLADETDRQLNTIIDDDDDENRFRKFNNKNSINDDDDDEISNNDSDDNDNDGDDRENKRKRKLGAMSNSQSGKNYISLGMASIIQRYRNSIPNRNELLDECNAVMERYEDDEVKREQQRQQSKYQIPDDDGFITVSYSKGSGSNNDPGRLQQQLDGSDDDDNDNDDDGKVTTAGGGGGGGRGGGANYSRSSSRPRSKKKKKGIGATELQDFYRFQTKEVRKNALHELRTKFEQDVAKLQQFKRGRH